MDPMESLRLYIAFSQADMQRIHATAIVDNAAFNGWIPLKATPGVASHAAMSSQNPATAALMGSTEWFVLEVSFNARQVSAMFLAKVLSHRDRELGAFYYKQALRLNPDICNWRWLRANCSQCQTSSGLTPAMTAQRFCTVCWHHKHDWDEQLKVGKEKGNEQEQDGDY
jgi:hypothetical protein